MRLLLVLPGAIGDFIVTSPSIVWLRHRLRPAWIEIWAERANLSLAESFGLADKAVALSDTGYDRWPIPQTVLQRLQSFDMVISWRGAANREWTDEICRRCGNIHFLQALPKNALMHAMDFRRVQLESLFGADNAFPPYPQVIPSREHEEFALEYLTLEIDSGRPIAMVHPGSSGPRKRWPAQNFSLLLSRLAGAFRSQRLICEGPLDLAVSDLVYAALNTTGKNMAVRRVRIDNLMCLAAVLKRCDLYVGNDSGIAHLAAASGTPTLAIFTATDPAVWAPRGPQAHVLVRPSVDEVFQRATEMMQASGLFSGSNLFKTTTKSRFV